MKKLIALLLGVAALVFTVPAAADPPTLFPFEFVIDDVDPCTGLMHTVTIAGTTWVHDYNGRIVAVSQRTITTSPTDFVGHGTDTYVLTNRIETFRLTDVLTSPSGNRIRARFVVVFDLVAGTVRATNGELTCLGPA